MRPAEPGHGERGMDGPSESAGLSFTHRAVIKSDPVADALALPASRGVVVMFGQDQIPVFMAATGDCRALARRKLAPAERGVRAGADLHAITREACAVACGSAFEADLVYLLLARQLMPHAAKLVADRWRSWWAQIDPDAEFPEWIKTDLGVGAVAPRSAAASRGMVQDAAGSIVGPFSDKDAAGRFIERMIDGFDLCREHRLLVQAPRALACPYKEMGRCAAPCDGSESMATYRQRVREALDAASGNQIAIWVEKETSAMQAAAAAQDFEAASRHKAQVQRLEKLAGPTAARIGQLEEFRFLLVWRSVREGWIRLAVCERGFVQWMADFELGQSAGKPRPDVLELCQRAMHWAAHSACEAMSREEVDVLGLLARERVLPDTKRSAWFVPLHQDAKPEESARAVLKAATAAMRPRKATVLEPADHPVHEIEAIPLPPGDEGASP